MASVNMVIVTDVCVFLKEFLLGMGMLCGAGGGVITDEICAMDEALNDSVLFFYCEMYKVKLAECCYL